MAALSSWFFLSYAWADNPDADPEGDTVSSFFKQVTNALAVKSADNVDETGFLDRRGIDIGESWPDKLTRALRGARSFMPLLTQRYFSREACGKEWGAFEARAKLHPPASELLIPVIWDKIHRVKPPPWLQLIPAEKHFPDSDLESVKLYKTLGMSQLVQRMSVDQAAAKAVKVMVDAMTDLIVDRYAAVGFPQAAESDVNHWDQLVPKFGGANAPTDSAAGKPVVHFAVAAATAAQIGARRKNALRFYPGADRDWVPYDAAGLSISQVAVEASRSFDLPCGWLKVDANLIPGIRNLENNGCQPVVLVVDPWSLDIQALKAPLESYDQQRFRNTVVIAAWNDEGADNPSQARANLQQALGHVFSRNLPLNGASTWFNSSVENVDALRDAVRRAITDIRALAAPQAPAMRGVTSNEPPPVVRNQ